MNRITINWSWLVFLSGSLIALACGSEANLPPPAEADAPRDPPSAGPRPALSTCDLEISEAFLEFGVVEPGSERALSLRIANRSQTKGCHLDLRLGEGGDPYFSLDPVEAYLSPLASGSEDHLLEIRVRYAPGAKGKHMGYLEIFTSNVGEALRLVILSGTAERPCLEARPGQLDFGWSFPGCTGREELVRLTNLCDDSLIVDAVHPKEDSAFSLDLPRLPRRLGPRESMEFTVAFTPEALGTREEALRIEASRGGVEIGPFLVMLRGEALPDRMQSDRFTQLGPPAVDLLWVVNNSASMVEEQALLEKTIPMLMKLALNEQIDLHLGVTTTAIGSGSTCEETGFPENEDGRLVPHFSLGRPRILSSSMGSEQLLSNFANNLLVGTCHDSSNVLEAARRALSPPWIDTPGTSGGNQGFLRAEASLSIIGLTDQRDEARWGGDPTAEPNVSDYVEYFRSLKANPPDGSERGRMLRRPFAGIHMISGGLTSCSGPGGEAEACPECVQAAEESGGTFLEICTDPEDPAWEKAILSTAFSAFGYPSSFLLRYPPADRNGDGQVDEEDLEVRVGGELIAALEGGKKVWRYNSENNSIAFAPHHVPAPNQQIEVTYQVACP